MTTLIEDGTLRLRDLKAADQADIYECMADWLPDERGEYTWARAVKNVSRWLLVSRKFNGQGEQVVVLEDGGEFIGFSKSTVTGTHATVDIQAIHPDKRGQGYLKHLNRLLRVYGFEVLGIESVSFDTRADPGRIQAEIDRLAVAETGTKTARSGRTLRTFSYDRAHREAHLPAEEAITRAKVKPTRGTP